MPTVIVVAFDSEDAAALCLLRRLQNNEIGDIAEGEDEISRLRGEVVANPVIVSEHQEFHGGEPCQLASNASRIWAMAVFTRQRNWFA